MLLAGLKLILPKSYEFRDSLYNDRTASQRNAAVTGQAGVGIKLAETESVCWPAVVTVM